MLKAKGIKQYFFINQRVIRDRVINHAIKQVYQEFLEPGKVPFYCLYLSVEPSCLDVNVHPTKHEVRFKEVRVIHNFLTETLKDALLQEQGNMVAPVVNDKTEIEYSNLSINHAAVKNNNTTTTTTTIEQPRCYKSITVIGVLQNNIILGLQEEHLWLINASLFSQACILKWFAENLLANNNIETQNLLMPKSVSGQKWLHDYTAIREFLLQLGFEIDALGDSKILVRSIPKCILGLSVDFENLFTKLHASWLKSSELDLNIFKVVAKHTGVQVINAATAQVFIDNIFNFNKLDINTVKVGHSGISKLSSSQVLELVGN